MSKITVFTMLVILIIISFVRIQCLSPKNENIWNISYADVVSEKTITEDSVHINIYIDATLSMAGFVTDPNSNYTKFLEKLESSAEIAWINSTVNFYKFGKKTREITLEEFKRYNQLNFYTEAGIFEETVIDYVIVNSNPSNINIVITDLFQNENDINSIILKIKENNFKNKIQLGILGIQSDFNGTVYDANVPPYNLNSTRPFYALILGNPSNIKHLFNSLKSEKYIGKENFLLISRKVTKKIKDVHIEKTHNSKYLNKISDIGFPDPFNFAILKGNIGGDLNVKIIIDIDKQAQNFIPNKLKIVAFRKKIDDLKRLVTSDSIQTTDLSLQNISLNGDTITAQIKLKLDEPKGTYSYMVCFQTVSQDAFEIPNWIQNWSSENPEPENDANKTLNLEEFVGRLINANSTIYQPKVAKFYITVRKL
ncbi:MAG: hypothetical protein ACXABG_11675 [Promethearchaeota archaeon]